MCEHDNASVKYKSGKSHQCDCPPSLGEVMGGGG